MPNTTELQMFMHTLSLIGKYLQYGFVNTNDGQWHLISSAEESEVT